MSSVVETPQKKVLLSPTQAADLLEVAKTARDAALDFARVKLPAVKRDLDLEFLLQQHDFLCAFKNALVENTCRVIGDYDAKALESYYFEPCTNPDAHSGEEIPVDGTLNIILVVNSLDRALTTALKELPFPLLDSYDSVLNVIPVTEEDIEKGKGYAVLLSSVHAPALKVWECS